MERPAGLLIPVPPVTSAPATFRTTCVRSVEWVSIGKLAAGREGYYLTAVARGRRTTTLGRGEAPGRWLSAGARLLGLSGQVLAEPLRAVLDGRDPSDLPPEDNPGDYS